MLNHDEVVELVEALNYCNSFKFGQHVLSGGKTSPYYIDLRLVQSEPKYFKLIIDSYIKIINNIGINTFDYICGIATSGLIFSVPISLMLNKPHIYIRKLKKNYGRQQNLEGNIKLDSKVLLIDDIFTSGSSLLDGLNIIHDSGSKVSSALVLVDRQETSHSIFSEFNIKLSTVLNIVDIAEILYSKSIIDNNQKQSMLSKIIN